MPNNKPLHASIITDQNELLRAPLLSEAVKFAVRNGGGIIDVTPATERWMFNAMNQLIKFAGNIRIDHIQPTFHNV